MISFHQTADLLVDSIRTHFNAEEANAENLIRYYEAYSATARRRRRREVRRFHRPVLFKERGENFIFTPLAIQGAIINMIGC